MNNLLSIFIFSLPILLAGCSSQYNNNNALDTTLAISSSVNQANETHIFDTNELVELNDWVQKDHPQITVSNVTIERIDDSYHFNYTYINNSDEMASNDAMILVQDIIFGLAYNKLDKSVVHKIIRGTEEKNWLKIHFPKR